MSRHTKPTRDVECPRCGAFVGENCRDLRVRQYPGRDEPKRSLHRERVRPPGPEPAC